MDRKVNRCSEEGLSLTEVMISSLVLMISLLAIAMTMAQGISAMFMTQEQLIAKQKAREALESVFTARNTQGILFNQIRNVSDSGIFLDGFQTIRPMGVDGMANTADDVSLATESVTFAGADNMMGTPDDEVRPLTEFERRVVISNVLLPSTSVDPDVRQITVQVRYRVRGFWWTVSVSSYISRFA